MMQFYTTYEILSDFDACAVNILRQDSLIPIFYDTTGS